MKQSKKEIIEELTREVESLNILITRLKNELSRTTNEKKIYFDLSLKYDSILTSIHNDIKDYGTPARAGETTINMEGVNVKHWWID